MMTSVPRRKPLPQTSRIFQPIKSPVNTPSPIITESCDFSSPIFTNNFHFPKTPIPNQNNMQSHTTTTTTTTTTTSPSTSTSSSPSSPCITRRTPSNSTFSTFASSNNGFTYRQNSQELTRPDSRSSNVPRNFGYVNLMRKQKATVWCDRAQLEDSRLLAQQKAAKIRASFEVTGIQTPHRLSFSGAGNLSSSNRVTAKIRSHGKASLVGYNPGDLIGGVPMRLSTTEVEGGDSNDEIDNLQTKKSTGHHRTDSGKSSTASNRFCSGYPRRLTAGSMTRNWSYTSAQNPEQQQSSNDGSSIRRQSSNKNSIPRDAYTNIGNDENECAGEKADSLTELYTTSPRKLPQKNWLKSSSISRNQSTKSIDQLRRWGSVDDRVATKNAVRLYIANPDVDSD